MGVLLPVDIVSHSVADFARWLGKAALALPALKRSDNPPDGIYHRQICCMSILYRTLSQILPDSLEKPRALTREVGYTTGSFVTCRYCIALCRKFRQMAWKSSISFTGAYRGQASGWSTVWRSPQTGRSPWVPPALPKGGFEMSPPFDPPPPPLKRGEPEEFFFVHGGLGGINICTSFG
jgi:hypothetical protein